MILLRSSLVYRTLRQLRASAVRFARRLRHVHATAYIHHTALAPRDLVAGEYVFIGRRCQISPRVSIGRYSMIASEVAIVGDDHLVSPVGVPMQFTGRPTQTNTVIGRDVWVGYRAILRRGIAVGDGAVIGAGAVVTRDVPPYEVWAGVPARRIAERFSNAEDRQLHHARLYGEVVPPFFASPQEMA